MDREGHDQTCKRCGGKYVCKRLSHRGEYCGECLQCEVTGLWIKKGMLPGQAIKIADRGRPASEVI